MCHITIDRINNTITREFTITKPTVAGKVNPFNYNEEQIFRAFNNDVYWTNSLSEDFVVKPISIDTENKRITYPFYGHDLFHDQKTFESITDFRFQILEMYEYFKYKNIFKGNGSRSNLILVNGKIKAFDFKWTRERPKNIKLELMSYEIWLKSADARLESDLKKMSGLEEFTHGQFTFFD